MCVEQIDKRDRSVSQSAKGCDPNTEAAQTATKAKVKALPLTQKCCYKPYYMCKQLKTTETHGHVVFSKCLSLGSVLLWPCFLRFYRLLSPSLDLSRVSGLNMMKLNV